MTNIRVCTEEADVYRRAARLLEKGALYNGARVAYACHALELAESGVELPFGEESKHCLRLKRVFAPRSTMHAWLCDGSANEMGRKNVRIIALSFMAAMVEAGDA